MALTDIGNAAAQSLTGGICKAIIEIEDNCKKTSNVEVTQVQARAAVPAGLGGASRKIASAASVVASAADKVPGLSAALNTLTSSIPTSGSSKKRFEVKFNPSQITFQGMGGGKVARTNFAAGENVSMQYQEMGTRIQMNLQLIFDDYERTEAFMLEKFSDTAAAARTVVKGAVSTVTGKTRSVRPQVEGFIGALRNDSTRKVAFYWGKMKYSGQLTHVSAEYNMFSTDGNPIRAVVNLGILCVGESVKDNHMGQWQDSYQKVFESDAVTNLGSGVQKAGNLLNMNV